MTITPGSMSADVLSVAFEMGRERPAEVIHEEELAVAVWRRNPVRWGLRGYAEQYPDTARVFARIQTVIELGYLVKSGVRQVQVTAIGRRAYMLLQKTASA